MKAKAIFALLTALLIDIGIAGDIYAQKQNSATVTVSGKVLDTGGQPLPGAGVMILGTSSGTVTGADGSYSLQAKTNQTLVFSYIGFLEQHIAIAGRSVIDCVLEEDTNLLDETVVVGYGTQSRKTLSTSVAKVDGDKLMDAPVSNVGDALKGKVAGLRVATSNSLAGESPRFMIRGGSSITMDNDPIYIVDGALRPDMDGINPNDIESMEILKDAASASIYGARASNGVILVTTRKGSASRGPQIVFDVQTGFSQAERKWDLLNSREQIALVRPAIANIYANSTGTLAAKAWLDGANVAVGAGNTKETNFFTTRYLDYGDKVPEGYQWMTDPVDPTRVLVFTDRDNQADWLKNAFWQKEYIGINGGNENMKYSASVSHLKDEGVVAMSGYQVMTAHGSTTFKIRKNLEASTTFDLSRQRKNPLTSNYFNAFGRGIMLAPTVRAYNSNGDWVAGAANANHEIASYYESFYDREAATNRASANFNLKWNILDCLSLTAQYNFFDNNYRGSYYAYGEVDGHPALISTTRSTTETRTETMRDTYSSYLSFNKAFGNHNLSATAGFEYMRQRYWYLTAGSTGSVSDDVPIIDSGINFTASNKDEAQALMSAFSRVQYDYKQRYIASVTFRADGSSKFAAGNRWGYFPAGSLAWVISEEPFFSNAKKSMNTFKMRASYGQTGNNGIGLYDTYGSFSTGLYNGNTTYSPSAMANAGMKWETTTQLDLGIDLGFCKDRIRILADYYNKQTDNMLFSIKLPDTGPYSSVKANVGSARFYGFELEIGTEPVRTRNFSWNLDFTYSFNRNEVLSLPEEYAYEEVDQYGKPTGKTGYRIGGYKMTESGYSFGGTAVGEPLGRIYGYKIDHIIQTEAEADAALYDASSKGHRVSDGKQVTGRKDAGDYEWCNRIGSAKDINGNEIINSEDMFYLGSVVPHSTGGINNTFRYKKLTFNVYLDYALGHSIYNYMKTRMLQNTIANSNSAIGRYVYDCWQYPGDTDAKFARYFPNDADYGNGNYGRCSDFNVE
ncbi:MAG: SusC/RagA family TonB-linked outer membrane protein, partial [Bacteroidales bacterium]|nr:SusC/RagA family TonB-linked outer membrane protein [Bacteroidales bacterium]